MDARRNQAYYGIYDVSGSVPEVVAEQAAAPMETVIRQVNETGQSVIFIGDGVPVFSEQLEREIKVPYRFGADSVRYQRASSVVALGRQYWEQGRAMPAEKFAPVYLRLSQAERERMENITTGNKAGSLL
jgi:tRNA threonylcarbamoyladenosine biosynthesis protein TsaB